MGDMEELDLRDILHIIGKRFWLIITVAALAAFLASMISAFFLDKIYSSSTTLIVSGQKSRTNANDLQQSDVNLARDLVNTYSVIIKSDSVLEKVEDEVNLDMPLEDLRSKISVNSENDTEIIRITVEDTDSQRAMDVANSLADVFMGEVSSLLKLDNVQTIDVAKAPLDPIRPRVARNTALAAVIGLVLGLGIAFLAETLDHTIKTPEDVEKIMGIPVLGNIPNFGK